MKCFELLPRYLGEKMIAAVLAGFAFFTAALPVSAQTWPSKPVRMIVAQPPGAGRWRISSSERLS